MVGRLVYLYLENVCVPELDGLRLVAALAQATLSCPLRGNSP